MAQQTMYPGMIGSPTTTLTTTISGSATSFSVANGNALPEAPNLATLGSGQNAEIVLYSTKSGNTLSGVTRGFQGSAQPHEGGTLVSRRLTAYDLDALRQNHEALVAQRGAVNGVASLDATGAVPVSQLSNAVRRTGDTMTGRLKTPHLEVGSDLPDREYGIRTWSIDTRLVDSPNEVEIDLGTGSFAGVLNITAASSWNVSNASGGITKSIDISGALTVSSQRSRYTHVSDTTRARFMISDIYLKDGRKTVKIVQNSGGSNRIWLTIQYFGLFSGIDTVTIGPIVPTVDTFVAPSGSNIHSSGSNANGEWVRFEDGTQICTRIVLHNMNTVLASAWTTPASFITMTGVSGGVDMHRASGSASDIDYWNNIKNVTTSFHSLNNWATLFRGTTIDAVANVRLMAIGRWR